MTTIAVNSYRELSPERVLTKATLKASQALGLKGELLAAVLGVSESSVSRLAAAKQALNPQSKEGELALLLIRLMRSLDTLVGGQDQHRLAWMSSFNHALNGEPRQLIRSAQGLVCAVAYLDSMRATH